MKLLHIIASPRGKASRTLQIAQNFITHFTHTHTEAEIDELNLYETSLPELTTPSIDGKIQLSMGNELEGAALDAWQGILEHIARFKSADAILVSAPMWNLSLPYKLKHYLDVIVQPRHTFQYGPNGPEGLVTDKTLYLITTTGGDYSENSPGAQLNFLTPYLKTIFGFIGLTDQRVLETGALDMLPPEESKQKVHASSQLAQSL